MVGFTLCIFDHNFLKNLLLKPFLGNKGLTGCQPSTKGGGADLDWVKAAMGIPDSRVASIF